MKLAKYNNALKKAKTLLQESASTVDALNRQMSKEKAVFRLTGANRKFAKIKKDVLTKFSPNAEVKLDGSDVVVVAPMKNQLETLLKRYSTVTREA